MHQTRVTAVNGRKVQADGKWLISIGNKDVSVGDWIWTDGKCVYGHESAGGGGYVPATNDGAVPILSSSRHYAIYGKQGYSFLSEGESHGNMTQGKSAYGFPSGDDLLDADIDGAGNLYALHSGKYEYKSNIGYFLKNYDIRRYRGDINYTAVHYPYIDFTGTRDDISYYEPEYCVCYDCEIPGDGTPTEENTLVTIKKNGETIAEIDLRRLFPEDNLDRVAFRYAEEKEFLMAQAGGEDFPPDRPCPEKSLHSRCLKAIGGKVDAQGNWLLIVEESVSVTFFPWLSYRNPVWRLEVYNLWAGRTFDSVRRDTHQEHLSTTGGIVKSWFKGTATVTEHYLVTPDGRTRLMRSAKAAIDYVPGVSFMEITDGVGRLVTFGGYESDGDADYGHIVLGDCLRVWAYTSRLSIPNQGSYWWGRAEGDIMCNVDTLTTTIGWNTKVEYYANQHVTAWCRIIRMNISSRQDGTFTKERSAASNARIPLQDGFYGVLDEEGEGITVYTSAGSTIASIPWTWESNIFCCSMGRGKYLVGIHGGDLWECFGGERNKLVGKLNNFRLRKMRNIRRWVQEGKGK